MAVLAHAPVPHQGAVGRLHMGAQAHGVVAPFKAHQFALQAQQFGRLHLPRQQAGVRRVQGLQALQVAVQRHAHIGDGIDRITLQPRLHLAGFVPPREPHHGDQHGHHQGDQCCPQRPAPPCAAPAAPDGARNGAHKTRWVRAGNCWRTLRSRSGSRSASTTPGPWACCASTWPQGSATRLWPQVWRPFSCTPPWAGATT